MRQSKSFRWGMTPPAAAALAGDVQSVTQTGSDLDGAAAITGEIVVVTAGTGGIRLPADIKAGDKFYVFNNSGANCVLYPPTSSGQINDETAGAGMTLSDNTAALVVASSATRYYTIPRAES